MIFVLLIIFSQTEYEILLKKGEKVFYPLKMEIKDLPQIKDKGFIITNFYFVPDDTAYVTDTTYTFYRITSYNWNIGDTVYWFFYYPDNDTSTGERTGEYIKCAEAKWVHTHEDSLRLLSYWLYELIDIWGNWKYGIEIIPVPSPEYLNDIDCGWGIRFAEKIYLSGLVDFFKTSFFPGKWYIELWRGPAGGNRYLIKKDSFELRDTFTYIKIISPSEGDTVIGETDIELKVLENHWAQCSLIVSTEPVKGQKEVWVKTFKVYRQKYPKLIKVPFNFGFNYGQRFYIRAKIVDFSGNIMETPWINVIIGRAVLSISLSPAEVLPYYQNVIPENLSTTQITIKAVYRLSQLPVKGYPIKVFSKALTHSGGHDHDGIDTLLYPRPTGVFTITEGVTNENGEFRTTYRASEFGGIERIFACGNHVFSDTVHSDLTVKIPGLILLPESQYYLKVGGTCNHHGPPKPWNPNPLQCQSPDHNHYIAPLTYLRLYRVCCDYYSRPPHHRLCINDISLPYGGLFDINGTWTPPHNSHRMGTDIDIAKRVVNEQGQVVGEVNGIVLRGIVRRIYQRAIFQDEGTHYHIRF